MNPKRRWATHLSTSKKPSKHQKYIHRAIVKYGSENFWFRCIDFAFSDEESLEKEKQLISLYDATNNRKGYNLTNGGEGKTGYRHTPETRKILSELASKKIGKLNPFYGKTHSDSAKNKIRIARSKLTKEQVDNLISAYIEENIPVKVLAKELNISISHARDLINGKYKR